MPRDFSPYHPRTLIPTPIPCTQTLINAPSHTFLLPVHHTTIPHPSPPARLHQQYLIITPVRRSPTYRSAEWWKDSNEPGPEKYHEVCKGSKIPNLSPGSCLLLHPVSYARLAAVFHPLRLSIFLNHTVQSLPLRPHIPILIAGCVVCSNIGAFPSSAVKVTLASTNWHQLPDSPSLYLNLRFNDISPI